ncbi:MAG TPA: acetylxylan esterase [Spirochaetota bacterium]|nr:acetylxylan esterase [Spirochaetota bacterium]HPI89848.1 acetylxylan esterase [Spirochaetota bacterium]HPR48639.1 acetylxylan esterase [Spirochaetota bacterium]
MAIENFDRYILRFPELDRQNDFTSFWQKATGELKGVPIEPVLKKNGRKSGSGFNCFDVSYKSSDRFLLSGELYLPHGNDRKKVIILIHDYNTEPAYDPRLFDDRSAYFIMKLRGHESLPKNDEDIPQTPGYMVERILDRDSYYVKGLYLDTLRAIEMLRLLKNLDCSSIGMMGKGLGAACCVFAAAYSDRVKAMVLDAPSFCELPVSQNMVSSDITTEINEFIAASRTKKKLIKTNLTYFDALNFSDLVKIPVLTVTGIKDRISPAECIFGLFNRLMCEKTIEVYPEDGHDAGGKKQFEKSIHWLTTIINTPE